ncbi:DUF362 domain-containing protein [Lachnoclostridium sp. An138]|uniref:DUF362 domain-containing protein n=1 Tax=Lachnoclostridium sp. An138 TaxID=1965560 RepID=UPI000B3A815B|nr:DUF362 domain-containing protein [Lachnoclostridium sp. An138]OUQ19544.1 (Fe-S)-binding protein [Lachnoclostridium sp. An138]
MSNQKPVPGTGGDHYIPYEQRSGKESVVYFTRDLSAEGLRKIYARISGCLTGKVGIKLHTGEPHGPNIIPRPWVEELIRKELPEAAIVETNTYYDGGRYTTEDHRETLKTNGWTFCPVDIMDEDGTTALPVKGGKWFAELEMGKNILNYDSLFVLTHFKGHSKGGFGGSNKNIGIGCADGRIGKARIHTTPGSDDQWDISDEEFMERMTESAKAVADHFGEHISYINVMRNMSVSCDCEGTAAEPVVTPNVGILASLDILAVDQASVDLVYAMKEEEHHALVERIESRHGLRQLTYMKELHMGNDRYHLIDIDNGDQEISPADGVKNLAPFQSAE